MNDGYKINEWIKWYSEYKEDIGYFIIVDNNSDSEYKNILRESFPIAKIIDLDHNGGCTEAYNEGIKAALSDKTVTHIALVGNDIRLEKGALDCCADLLDADDKLGMVAPILLEADSLIVADYGCDINNNLTMRPYGIGMHINDLRELVRYCEAVTGGMNVAKREFYESVGFQDNKLFMYSDEVDMGLRAAKKGYRLAVLKSAKSWHQHINPPKAKRRHPFSQYLIGRNKVYLAKKHFGVLRSLSVAKYYFLRCLKDYARGIIKMDGNLLTNANWMLWGVIKGLSGDMKPNRFSSL